jgi:anaerobic ribonucleoside-triphosphate reductase activating protein
MQTNQQTLNIHMIEPITDKLGPFNRFVFWVNDCDKTCPGCLIPASVYQRNDVFIDHLAAQILAQPDIEGLTISGGEPFLQAHGITTLIKKIREHRDLGIIVYTGYVMAELIHPHHQELLKHIDLIIDGRYVKELDDGKSLRGSSNQKVIPLTSRYRDIISQHYGLPVRRVDMEIKDDGFRLVGVPTGVQLKTYHTMLNIMNAKGGKSNG